MNNRALSKSKSMTAKFVICTFFWATGKLDPTESELSGQSSGKIELDNSALLNSKSTTAKFVISAFFWATSKLDPTESELSGQSSGEIELDNSVQSKSTPTTAIFVISAFFRTNHTKVSSWYNSRGQSYYSGEQCLSVYSIKNLTNTNVTYWLFLLNYRRFFKCQHGLSNTGNMFMVVKRWYSELLREDIPQSQKIGHHSHFQVHVWPLYSYKERGQQFVGSTSLQWVKWAGWVT